MASDRNREYVAICALKSLVRFVDFIRVMFLTFCNFGQVIIFQQPCNSEPFTAGEAPACED